MSESNQAGPSNADKKKKKATRLGDFRLKKKLGEGGMGTVYLATQVSLDRKVALKTLSKALAKQEDFVKRFIREARSMAKLDHQNVVKVYAVDSDKGIHYAAIEFIDGRSAQDWLDQLEKFSIGDALNVIISAAQGLKAAHDEQIVHRDIKPDNILITNKGVTKVADFGLAKGEEDTSMTQSGAGLGTPLYMAPEQARSAKYVDQRSDIYSLGATLYHMLTGKLPFLAETALELIMAKETGKFPPARSINAEIPDRLNLMIDKMLSRDAAHRYPSCDELLADLVSLNLANPVLSFIDGAQPSLAASGVALSQSGAGRSTRPVLGTTSSKLDAERREAEQRVEKIWFVQHKDKNGKKTLSKMTTDQVLKAIKVGLVDAKSKAKGNAGDQFTPVAHFTEFKEAIQKGLVKKTAKRKADSMTSLYQQTMKAERNRHRWRWLRNLTGDAVGLFKLTIYLLILAGIITVLVLYGKNLADWVMNQLGLGSEAAAPKKT